MSDVLQRLDAALAERRGAGPDESYVAALHQTGLDGILRKVGEEAVELLLAAKQAEGGAGSAALIRETADLWFHCMVMLSHLGADSGDVLAELERRFGISGHAEKASRATRAGKQTDTHTGKQAEK